MRRIIDERTRRLSELAYLIREFGREEDLGEWNRVQFQIWLKLVEMGLVDGDDLETFIEFGRWFYEYWQENERVPTVRAFQRAGIV